MERSEWSATGAMVARMRRPVLLSHAKPDGDAFGSLIAMREISRALGNDPLTAAFDRLPHTYDVFRRFEALRFWPRDVSEEDLAGVDGVIILDTCTYNQIEPLADWVRDARVPKVAVDHHLTRDDLADHYVIDETAPATCALLHDWARLMNWPIGAETAQAMFLGLATDTGWFAHSNTNHAAFRIAADLVDRGVLPNQIYQHHYQSDTVARIRLKGAMLHHMTLHADDRLAVMRVDQATLAEVGATLADTENLINEPLAVRAVIVSVLLSEQKDGPVRVSFRSKAPMEGLCERDIDVSRVAAFFGGGGHRRAAAARVPGSLESVGKTVIDHLTALLKRDSDSSL